MRPRPVALDVVGEVQAALGNDTVVINAARDTILVDLPGWRVGLTPWRRSGRRAQREKALRRAHAMLQLADLTVHVRLMGRIVARLGAKARPGLLSWALGVRPLQIIPSAVLGLSGQRGASSITRGVGQTAGQRSLSPRARPQQVR